MSYFTGKGREESNIGFMVVVGIVVGLPMVVVILILFIFCCRRFAKQQEHSGSVNTTTPASQQPFVSHQSQDDRVNAKTLETEKNATANTPPPEGHVILISPPYSQPLLHPL